MAALSAVFLGLGFLYFWLCGWWFIGLALAVAWSLFAGANCTLPQFAFILGFSFAPFLTRFAWRNRAAIRQAMLEDSKSVAFRDR
ncbi:hypothetical protein HN018_19260 [Lichenicola cladoniae]|uniref:Uncharacterized protein n=1 Tax=Lichenicola cladoniae TaxID=1484109 RepID=A0A6M8HUM0_9PROT|nr:hypothetical protein [Lichenicola cladoniae]NPD68286.1 hypothetical protein [Acetobacteraceae bacterium]QKE91885.1 hypothetical protein HN018_19260 [Lichenicola cladoniae]